ncbi:MAG: triose-phosphate isomerase [Candidatus Pacebacteria bacterium]|jgi:triosephosphate isomerase|nr:triose-phosphate isomerase [Candidatus Paceibacterota bacterium]
MNTIYIIGNWKEYPETLKDAAKLSSAIGKIAVKKGITAVVCPPFPFLQTVGAGIKKGKYILGAQDLSPMMIGAYTGEVSPKALVSLGVKYAIIGHSERRTLGEDNDVVLMKLKAAHAAGVRPILCVGEHDRKDTEHSHADVRDQLIILEQLSKKELANTIIAYEPLWAIGAKVAATPEDAREMRIYIQKVIADMVDEKALKNIAILYGGSVTAKNAKEFISVGGMHGLLVGRASLEAKSFVSIISSLA